MFHEAGSLGAIKHLNCKWLSLQQTNVIGKLTYVHIPLEVQI